MKSVKVTIDGITYTLTQTSSGNWVVTNRAPLLAGEYAVEVKLTNEYGKVIVLNADDPELVKALTLLVTQGTTIIGKRMLDYYPELIKAILEFQALMMTEGFEFDFATCDFDFTWNDVYLSTMSEARVVQWEKALGITPLSADTLEQRRDVIIAKFRGTDKLNTNGINAVVSAFTGGTANSYFDNGVLTVEVTPPTVSKVVKFSAIEEELKSRIPAHIELKVVRKYSTWNDIKSLYNNWQAMHDSGLSWFDIYTYLPPQGE